VDEDFPVVTIFDWPAVVEITNGFAGDKLPYVADWSWAGTADYDIVLDGGWSAHFGGAVRYVGDRVNTTTNLQEVFLDFTTPPTLFMSTLTEPLEVPSYWALDLNASMSNEHWTLRAYAKNVTDERGYQSVGDVTSAITGETAKLNAAPIQPRTFGLEVDYTF
jgi:outer membrane receptor protein involved in Fe transport